MFFFSKNHYHSIVVKILPSFRSKVAGAERVVPALFSQQSSSQTEELNNSCLKACSVVRHCHEQRGKISLGSKLLKSISCSFLSCDSHSWALTGNEAPHFAPFCKCCAVTRYFKGISFPGQQVQIQMGEW